MSKTHRSNRPHPAPAAPAPAPAAPATPVVAAPTGELLKTKHLAIRFKMKPQALRRVLRSMAEYSDGVHTNYAWDETKQEGRDQIARIVARLAKNAAEREAAKVAAQAALVAKATPEATTAPAPAK